MAIGPDRVRVVKWESAATGGDAADEDPMGVPTPIETLEDALQAAGMYVHAPAEVADETVGFYRDGNELWFFDTVTPYPGVRLAVLSGGALVDHAPTHEEGGTDEIQIENLATASAAGYFPVTNGLGGVELMVAPAPAFGTEIHTAESAATATTTSGTFQNKLTMTTSSLAGGTYILMFSATVAGTANNTVAEAQVVHGLTQLNLYQIRLSTANAEFAVSGFKVLTMTGAQDFYINYRKVIGSGSSSIKDARLALWRIG